MASNAILHYIIFWYLRINILLKLKAPNVFFVLFTVLTFIIILLIHLLTKIIAYILLIAVSLMVLGNIICLKKYLITLCIIQKFILLFLLHYVLVNVFLLWWEYFTLKFRLDNTVEAQTLSADACNEHTFLILAILFSLFSVN